jgi:biopolymer transport protein ExbD
MATIMEAPGMRRRAGVRRMKKHSLKTDMTPMVDLGFLLIAFFVVTAELSEPRVANLNMPHDGAPMPLPMSDALTVLIAEENTIYYYHGEWEQSKSEGKIFKTSLSGKNSLGDIIRQKQAYLDKSSFSGEGKDGLMLLIKANKEANYETVINVLDEALINTVKKYALVKLEPAETDYLNLQSR